MRLNRRASSWFVQLADGAGWLTFVDERLVESYLLACKRRRIIPMLRGWMEELLPLTFLIIAAYLTYLGSKLPPTFSFWLNPKLWGLAFLSFAMVLVLLELYGKRSLAKRSLAAVYSFVVVLGGFFLSDLWRDPWSWALALAAGVTVFTLLQLFGGRPLAQRCLAASIVFALVFGTFSVADFRRNRAEMTAKSIQEQLGTLSWYSIQTYRSTGNFPDIQQQSHLLQLETLSRSSTEVSYAAKSSELPGTWELNLGPNRGDLKWKYGNSVLWEAQLFTGTVQMNNEQATMFLSDGKIYNLDQLAKTSSLMYGTDALAVLNTRNAFSTLLLPSYAFVPSIPLNGGAELIGLRASSGQAEELSGRAEELSGQAGWLYGPFAPEPATLSVIGAGLIGVGAALRRKLLM